MHSNDTAYDYNGSYNLLFANYKQQCLLMLSGLFAIMRDAT